MGNQDSYQIDNSSLVVKNSRFAPATIAAGENLEAGTVLGVTTADKHVACVSASNDGSQNARAILFTDVDASGGDKQTMVLIEGDVDASHLKFDAADDLNTRPTGSTENYETQLRGYGIYARDIKQLVKE